MQNIIKFKNAIISGVVSVQCARHGFYLPGATVDLEKGEAYIFSFIPITSPHSHYPRYARTDYALKNALEEAHDQRWIMLTYDIWCQYHVNLLKRFGALFPNFLSTARRICGAVPKLHIQGHTDECQQHFSLNYLPYSGETYGEGIESSWSVNNESGGSTKQQNHGHRHDSLDDGFAYWNWQKLMTLGMYFAFTVVNQSELI